MHYVIKAPHSKSSCSAWGIVYLLYIRYFAHKGTSYKAKLYED